MCGAIAFFIACRKIVLREFYGEFMKFTELKKFIEGGGSGAYLLCGDDAYFLSHAEEMLKKAYVQMSELNYA